MKRLIHYIISRRAFIILDIAILTILGAWQLKKIRLNADFSTYLSKDDPIVKEYNRVGRVFGGNDVGIVLISTAKPDEALSREILSLDKKLSQKYASLKGISYVTSLTNVIDFRKTDDGLEVGQLFNNGVIPDDSTALAEIARYILSKDRYVSNFVTPDGRIDALLLRFEGKKGLGLNQYMTALQAKTLTDQVLADAPLPHDTKIYFGGLPFMIYNMTLLITGNLFVLVPVMIFLLLFVLYFSFRHWAGVVFPLLVVLVSTIWITGLMAVAGLQFNLLTGIMPVVLLAMGSADAIHLMKRYYERRKSGDSAGEATVETFIEMGTPIFLTTITTMAGFASLFISDFSVIREFGLLTALGVGVAFVITLTLLPALLSFGVHYHPVRRKEDRRDQDRRFRTRDGFEWYSRWIFTHRRSVVIGSIVIVLVALVAIPSVKKDVDWTLCLARGSDPYHAEMLLRKRFGGSLPVQVVVDGNLKDPAVMHTMRNVELKLETIPHIHKSQSMAGIIAEMNDVMNDRYAVPADSRGISNLWLLVDGKDEIRQITTDNAQEGIIQAKLDTWHTGTMINAVDQVDHYLNELPKKVAVVDISKLPAPKRKVFLDIRKKQMTGELGLFVRKYGIPADNKLLSSAADTVIHFTVNRATRSSVAGAIAAYLNSDQAEVSLKPHQITTLSRVIANQFDQIDSGDNVFDDLSKEIRNTVPAISRDDAEWLAGSLKAVADQALGEARVEPGVALINKEIPGLQNRKEVLNRIKGILWQASQSALYVDQATAKSLTGSNRDAIERIVPMRFHQSGMPEVLKSMEQHLTPTQLESLLTSLIFVLILMTLIFRSVRIGLVSIVPITLTIILNFGAMGYIGIGLDSFTAMIASIAIGLGIDAAIHFISRFQKEYSLSLDKLTALTATMKSTGFSIMINALAVGLGFLVLLGAGGQHIRRFGGLTSLTILVSAIFTLSVFAVLIISMKPEYLLPKQHKAQPSGICPDIEEENYNVTKTV